MQSQLLWIGPHMHASQYVSRESSLPLAQICHTRADAHEFILASSHLSSNSVAACVIDAHMLAGQTPNGEVYKSGLDRRMLALDLAYELQHSQSGLRSVPVCVLTCDSDLHAYYMRRQNISRAFEVVFAQKNTNGQLDFTDLDATLAKYHSR